jgi:hypothetical protein
MRTTGLTARQLDQITDTNMGGHYLTAASQPAIPTAALWDLVRPHCGEVPAWVDELVQRIEAEREVVGRKRTRDPVSWYAESARRDGVVDITAPATPEAQQWAGWGTALKPSLEPITMARKPLAGTVAGNVLEHGTGALNIEGCRVGTEARPVMVRTKTVVAASSMSGTSTGATQSGELTTAGRWPANLIHDGSDEPTALLGSAARFFYTAKASRADRGHGNNHPTVKPLDLMAYLCRLVTPPGGTVLDPFMGSGTTIKAALSEGFDAIGIERDPAYYAIAQERLNGAQIGLAFDL